MVYFACSIQDTPTMFTTNMLKSGKILKWNRQLVCNRLRQWTIVMFDEWMVETITDFERGLDTLYTSTSIHDVIRKLRRIASTQLQFPHQIIIWDRNSFRFLRVILKPHFLSSTHSINGTLFFEILNSLLTIIIEDKFTRWPCWPCSIDI